MRVLSLILIILWILLWTGPVALAYALRKHRLRSQLAMFANKGIVYLCHVRVKTIGEPATHRPLILASNHVSYLDIPVLSSVVDCRFVAKKEIADWPFINKLCRMMGVIFIDRHKGKIHEGHEAIRTTLATGDVVTFFPEATTGDGKRLLPFKPAFFEVAKGAWVQPVAIAYRRARGLPIDYGLWPQIAWYGDMVLMPHLLNLLSLGKIEVEVHFMPAIEVKEKDRKMVALQAHDAIEAILVGQGNH